MMRPDKNIQRNRWYRTAVAVIFGLLGFAVNFLDIQLLESPEFKVSILLGLIFPLLIALAWGWRYGLLSALAGGCQSMWWLWRSDGYGFLYAVPVFTLWVVWHGYWADQRTQTEPPRWPQSPFAVEVPFRVLVELGFFTVFPWLVSFNPPPWNPAITWTLVPIEWSVKVALKHTISAYLLLLTAHALLCLTPIRRFFGLSKLPAERIVNAVYACSLLMGTALWMVDSMVTYLAFNPTGQTFWEIVILAVRPHDLFMRNMYFLISVAAGVFVARFLIHRKRAEDELAANYALLRIAGETARFGGWRVDLRNNLCTWSDIVADIHDMPKGYAPSVEEGIRFYAPEWRDRITRVFTDCAEKGIPYDEEMEIITRTGRRVWVRTAGEPVRETGGNIVKVQGSFQDISDSKRAEESLKMERSQLLSIFGSIDEVIYVADPDTYEILYVNQAIRKAFQKEMIGGICYREFQGFDAPCEFCTNEIILKQKPHPYRWEYHNPVLDRDFAIVDRIITWPDGRDVRFELAIDITDRRRAEGERAELQAQLNQAQKMESVGRLAGGVAHDFNNKLSVILGYAQLAMEDLGRGHPIYEKLQQVMKAGEQSVAIVRQLLAFARKQTIAPRVLDLNETIEGMLKMLRRLIGEDIDLAWGPEGNLWPVKMDPSQIDQILANLCVNARDAISGVGRVSIETGNVRLDENYCADRAGFMPGEYILLTVSDNGSGMDKETLANAFEPFFTTKEVGKGTGLGLSTVYGIVRQNNGFVNIYSEPGRGTSVKIYLPRNSEDAEEKAEIVKAEIPQGRGETVLVVEDEISLLRLAQEILEKTGYRVLTSGAPGEAVAITREHSGEIHLLMTDVVLPEMSGKDLAAKIMQIRPNIGILFMSGYTADVIAQQGVLDEGVAFIEKPFTSEKLARKVGEAIDQ